MQNQQYITEFANEEAFDNAFDTLSFPNVSHLVEEGEVRYSEENPYMILLTMRDDSIAPSITIRLNSTSKADAADRPSGGKTYAYPVVGSECNINLRTRAITSLANFLNTYNDKTTVPYPYTGSYIKKIVFPKAFTVKGDTMCNMFYGVGAEEIVGIEDWDVSGVVSFKGCFSGCNKLKRLDLSKWDTSSADDLRDFVAYVTSLYTLSLPQIGDGTKDVVKGDYLRFYGVELENIEKSGAIHNSISLGASTKLTIESVKVVLRALSTPYNGAQTVLFAGQTMNKINADAESLALVAAAQEKGWTIRDGY